jgi:hypothetical protein
MALTTQQIHQTRIGELVKIGRTIYVRDDYVPEYDLYYLPHWGDMQFEHGDYRRYRRSKLVHGSTRAKVGFTALGRHSRGERRPRQADMPKSRAV